MKSCCAQHELRHHPPMPARQVIYSGRVQGVGFRYTVKRIASGFEVTGWVRNLPDGRVELQAMSHEEDELAAFLDAVQTSSLGGNIRDVVTNVIPPLTGVRGFTIAY
jgi:acylphosphatase